MREIILILSLIAAGLLAQAGERPNVVFILSDDQSWGDYGFMGHPHLKTPHLDEPRETNWVCSPVPSSRFL